MINKLLSLEEGRNSVFLSFPHIDKCDASDCELVEVAGGKIVINVHGRKLKVNSPEDRTFKSIVGVDPVMMSRLSGDLQRQCWQHLVSNSNKYLTLKTRDETIVGLLSGDDDFPNYREWTDRIIEEVDKLDGVEGLANITKNHSHVGFGVVTRVNHEPPTRRGDLISQGLFVTMNGMVTVSPYNLRLACVNGAVATEQGDAYHLNETHWREQLARALGTANIFTAASQPARRPLNDPGGLVGSLF